MCDFQLNPLEIYIQSEQDTDFDLVVNQNKYGLSSLIAASYSDKLFNLFLEDPLSESLEITLENSNFEDGIKIINGKKVEITNENAKAILELGIVLQCKHLINETQKIVSEQANPIELFKLAFLAFKNHMKCPLLVDKAAENFEEIAEGENLSNYSDEFLEIIFRSPKFIYDLNKFKELLFKRIGKNPSPNHRFIVYIPFQVCRTEEVIGILHDPQFNYNRVRSILSRLTMISDVQLDNLKIFAPIPGKEFDGIIRQMQVPVFSASSIYSDEYRPEILAGEPSDSYFCSKNGPQEWVMMDFGKLQLTLSHYALRAWQSASNRVCPRSWTIEGSNDGITWSEVDTVDDDESLASDGAEKIFQVKVHAAFSMFRFMQRKANSRRNPVLALAAIELFGKARE